MATINEIEGRSRGWDQLGKRKNMKRGGTMKVRSKKQQRTAAELGEIITEMGQAMWNADKKYIATSYMRQ